MHFTSSFALAGLVGLSAATVSLRPSGVPYYPSPYVPQGTGLPRPPNGTGYPQPPGSSPSSTPSSSLSTPSSAPTYTYSSPPYISTWPQPPASEVPPPSTVTVTVTATETKVVGYTYCPTGNYPQSNGGETQDGNSGSGNRQSPSPANEAPAETHTSSRPLPPATHPTSYPQPGSGSNWPQHPPTHGDAPPGASGYVPGPTAIPEYRYGVQFRA